MARRRQTKSRGNFAELLIFVGALICIYFILSLFGSSLTGDSGREWGRYLKKVWGGAVIVPLLFMLYVCTAKLLRLKAPRLRRQTFGTIMLYISLAFLLGVLRESGWSSELTLFTPGNLGLGLAKFFMLNVGTFITLILVIASFVLSAVLFGSNILKLTVPTLSRLNPRKFFRRFRRRRQRLEEEEYYPDSEPAPDYDLEAMLFTDSLQAPTFSEPSDTMPSIPSSSELFPSTPPARRTSSPQNTVEMIDNALAILDSEPLVPPQKKPAPPAPRTRRVRRPIPQDEPEPEESQDSPEPQAPHVEAAFPPPLDLFGPAISLQPPSRNDTDKQAKIIVSTLKNFGVNASVAQTVDGPSATQYLLELAPGTKVNRVAGLDEELTMATAAMSVRIEAPILGTHYVGIEVGAAERMTIPLRSILESQEFTAHSARLPLPMGVRIDGRIIVSALDELGHILIAGTRGAGKSTFINSCIMSMCSRLRPDELKFILIDPRHVELAAYDELPNLMAAPVNDSESALKALQWAHHEIDERNANFAREKVRTLTAYNRKISKSPRTFAGYLPEVVIVINELADLMYSSGGEIERLIVRIAQKSGLSGVHMIIATERTSPDVLTTMIKSNIPTRAVFSLASQGDSKNVLGTGDAEKLLGKGDMLLSLNEAPRPIRLQAPYVSEEEVYNFAEYMSGGFASPTLTEF